MSKIRTSEQLLDNINEEMAWRKHELGILHSVISKSTPNTAKSNALIRSGVTVLYAHWEGFIRFASIAYLEFISRQDLTYGDLTLSFRAIAVNGQVIHPGEGKQFTHPEGKLFTHH